MIVSWKHVLTVYLSARLAASVAGIAGGMAIPAQGLIAAGGYEKPVYSRMFELLFGVWERADVLWYLHIARDGYDPSTHDAVFMPLFPFLIRGVHYLSFTLAPWILAGLIVANVACVLALYFFHRLVEAELGESVARKASWYLMFFPGSLFLLVPYTESTFVALAAGSLLAARNGRWAVAGCAAAALALTRNLGVAIVGPLLLEWIRHKRSVRDLLWLGLPPLALGLWMLHWHVLAGDALAFMHRQSQGWGREPRMPWVTWWEGMMQALQYAGGYPGGVYVLEALAVLWATVLGLAGLRLVPVSWSAWLWMGFLPTMLAPFPGRMLTSCLRYMAVLFPAFATLALVARGERADQLARAVLTALFGVTAALYVANQYMF